MIYRLLIPLLAIGVVAGCSSTVTVKPRSLTLLDATRTPLILVPAAASAAETFAANELRNYLTRIGGATVTIASAVSDPAQPLIVIGAHPLNAELAAGALDVEDYTIDVGARGVRIIGGRAPALTDSRGGEHVQERGTIYGVYAFLESLGVRWYRPDPWGEHVPRLQTIALPLGRQTVHPGYTYRNAFASYRWWRDETPEQRAMGRLWALRQRQNVNLHDTGPERGGYYEIDTGHAYQYRVPHDLYFKEHPEYFALIDGQRSTNRQAQLCLSNPEVVRLVSQSVIALARANPHMLAISVEPNDGSLWCECAACRALDDPALTNGARRISMANRVCAFNNQVASNLAVAVPGARINWYAYNRHTEVPTRVPYLATNTLVWAAAYAGAYSDWTKALDDPTSVQNARFVNTLRGYGALTQLMVYEYSFGYKWFGPEPILGRTIDRLRGYRRYGVVGLHECGSPHWGPQGMVAYLIAQLTWNPDLDVARELELYYKNYYGPAAEAMKRYDAVMEEAVPGAPYFGSGGSHLENFFTDVLLARMAAPITEARALVRGLAPYERRLAGVWAGYEFARRMREVCKLRAAKDFPGAAQACQELESFVLSHPDGDVFNNGPGSEPLRHLRKLGKDLLQQAEAKRP